MVLVRVGLMLLIASLLVRPAIQSEANLVGDDLAVLSSAVLMVAGMLYTRLVRQ